MDEAPLDAVAVAQKMAAEAVAEKCNLQTL